ncbi:MAG: hypothetical protein ACE5IM_08795, partial [Nitrospinota bacterium]
MHYRVASAVTGKSIPRFMHNGRLAWGKVTFRIWRHALTNPNGTNLARGDIGSFGKIGHGGKYPALPGYIEPEDLDRLPDEVTKTGRDKVSIYGFFNRAHADWWCEDNLGLMEELRASRNKRRQAACVLLADRFYAGTDRAYKGGNREDRTHNKKASGKRILPICSICGNRKVPAAGYDERIPITLAPGYVSEPYRRSRYGFSTNSVENWCRKVPVLDLMKEPKYRDDDVVALVRNVKKVIHVTGANLGNRMGKIVLDGEIVIQESDILNWSDGDIRFLLKRKRALPDSVWVEIQASG